MIQCNPTIWDQTRPYGTMWDHMGPNPIIWDQNPTIWDQIRPHLGTRHAGDWPRSLRVLDMLELRRDHRGY